MEFEIIGRARTEFTDQPRQLTNAETILIKNLSRIGAIKAHRALTNSTLNAAIRCVDEIQDGSAQ